MRFRFVILLYMVAQGCTCGDSGGGCEPQRSLQITQTAPPGGSVIGPNQKFGFMASDSENDPASLVAAVKTDDGTWTACQLNTDADQVIEETRSYGRKKAYGFRCPISAANLSGGPHSFEYSVDGARRGAPARSTTKFSLDNIPPILSASLSKASGQNSITFQVSDEEDFDGVALFINKVRVTTSHELEGELIIDASIRRRGSQVEVRAYDANGNFDAKTFELK